MKFLAILIIPCLLASCVSKTPDGEALPVLASPARESAWGSPKVVALKNGYQRIYENPSNKAESLKIKGSRELLYGLNYPPNIKGEKIVGGKKQVISTPQVWQKGAINGEEVYLYQSHYPIAGEGPRHKTLGAELKDPKGVVGYYSVEVEGTNQQARRWLSELSFVR